MLSPEYIREVINEWASKQPDPKPLTPYEREILYVILNQKEVSK